MNVEEVLKVFEGIIKDPRKLQNAGEILGNLLNTQAEFGLITCKVITSSDFDIKFRKLTGYLIKEVLKDNWMSSSTLASQRKDIKEILLNGLVLNANDFKIIEVLSLITSELVKQEGVDAWQVYLRELVLWMNSEEIERIGTGLEFLCLLFSNNSKGLHVLVPELMPILFQIFTIPELPERLMEKLLMLVYLSIDSFAWADNDRDEIVRECFDRTYQEWLSLFISVLQTSAKSRLKMKKYILKILNQIFSELPKYSRKSIGTIIQPVWKFMNSTLPLYIWHVVYDVPIEDIEEGMKQAPEIKSKNAKVKAKKNSNPQQEDFEEGFELEEDAELTNEVEAMAVQLISLMRTMVVNMQLRPILKIGIFPLVNCISHYMLFTRRMEMTWTRDLTEFVIEEKDETNSLDLRRGVLGCLSDLIENFADDATQAIRVVSEKFLKNIKEEEVYGFLKNAYDKLSLADPNSALLQDFDSEKLFSLVKTSHFEGEHPDLQWKKREVGLLLIGSFAEDIVTLLAKKMNNFDIIELVERLIGDFYETSNPIIKGRTLWCITQFSEVLTGKGVETLLSLYKLSATCLVSERYLSVRLAAVKSIRTFAFKILRFFLDSVKDEETRTEFRINDFEVINSLFEVLEESDENLTHLLLETIFLLAKINPQFIDKITEKLAPRIIKMFQDLRQSHQVVGLLKDIIRTFSTSEKAYHLLAKAFLPYIVDILRFKIHEGLPLSAHVKLGKATEEEFLSSLFELTRLFVKSQSSSVETAALMEILPLLIKVMLTAQDPNVLTSSSACLKSFVMYFSPAILKMGYLDDIKGVISKILSLDTNEMGALYIGNLVILTFANLLNNNVDTNILKQVITKLAKCNLPSIIQSLVLIYSRLINTNEKEALGFLSSFSYNNKLALKILVDKWLLQQPLFRGKNTKVSTFLALTKLFLAKDNRIETLLVIGFNPSHTNMQDVYAPLKILCLLARGLDNEKKSRAMNGRIGPGGNPNAHDYDDDGRLDTVQDEDDYDDYGDDDDDEYELGDDEIDLDIQKDDEPTELEKRFNLMGEKKGGGLKGLESQSVSFISGMLEYEPDMEEADEIAEEDLIYLQDLSTKLDLVEMLKEFFVNLAKNDPQYYAFCLKHMLPGDVKLIRKFSVPN